MKTCAYVYKIARVLYHLPPHTLPATPPPAATPTAATPPAILPEHTTLSSPMTQEGRYSPILKRDYSRYESDLLEAMEDAYRGAEADINFEPLF